MSAPFTVTPLVVGQLQSNCFLYQVSKTEAIIIDPGDDDQYIIQKLQERELTPLAMLATHGHFDHTMAGFSLQATYNIPFYIHSDDEFLLLRMRETAMHFTEIDPGPPPIVKKYLEDNAKLEVGNVQLQVIGTPGHTPGSVTFYDKANAIAFVGDLLFSDGSIGEVTHKYSDRAAVKKSIQKIMSLPPETVIYSGHGDAATVEDLLEQFEWALRSR